MFLPFASDEPDEMQANEERSSGLRGNVTRAAIGPGEPGPNVLGRCPPE